MSRYRLPIFALSANLGGSTLHTAGSDGAFNVSGADETAMQLAGGVPAAGGTPGSVFASAASIKLVTAFPYTIVAADLGQVLRLYATGAVTVNVPAGLGLGFHTGFIQAGSGVVTFVAGSGALVTNRQGFTKTAGLRAAGSLIADALDDFTLAGDLSA